MSKTTELALRQASEELRALYDGATEGILAVDAESQRFVRANRAICKLLGYSSEELLSLSVPDIHPAESLPQVQEAFEGLFRSRIDCARNIPCLRKDGVVVYVDITASYSNSGPRPTLVGFFRDVTEPRQIMELLRISEDRYRLIADNVDAVIWTTPITLSDSEKALAQTNAAAVIDAVMERWRFSYVSPAVERVFGYTAEDIPRRSLRDITTPAAYAHIRQVMIEEFMEKPPATESSQQKHVLEAEILAKDGSSRWCEVFSAYLRDADGVPTTLLGITRDISRRREAERALRESESKLRSLFENLPDIVLTIDRDANVHFINRDTPDIGREAILGACAYSLVAPEHQPACRRTLEQALASGQPQNVQFQDIFGRWWLARAAPLPVENGDAQALVICTDVTQERVATEAVNKERQLLRRLLDLHERQRRLTAYEIHDGFAQHLAGALFRLQAFREMHSHNPTKAWEDLDSAVRLISGAIDDTRRLISGLRPPILDESGIIHAIDYLICEQRRQDGPDIEFVHDVAFDRLPAPLESALFRVAQESLQNACRHSRSDRIRIELSQRENRVYLDVRDWGVGFVPEAVEEQRFGLQGIRERVRLMDGHVVIESAPNRGTHIGVELPLVDAPADQADAPDGR